MEKDKKPIFSEYLLSLGSWCSPDLSESNKQLVRVRQGFHAHIKAKHGGVAIPQTCHKCLHYQHDIQTLNHHIANFGFECDIPSESSRGGNIY